MVRAPRRRCDGLVRHEGPYARWAFDFRLQTLDIELMNFTHPHFESPHWLWLAVLGPGLLFWLQRYAARARRQQLARVASPHFIEELTRSHSPARRGVKEVLLLAVVALLGLALARPQWESCNPAINGWART